MEYLGAVTNDYDLVNKKYVDNKVPTKVGDLTNDSGFVTHDTNVTQTNTTDSASYRILLSNSANDTTEIAGARKGAGLQFNPSTKNLYVSTGTTNGNIYMGLSTSDSLYTIINELGWTSSVIE